VNHFGLHQAEGQGTLAVRRRLDENTGGSMLSDQEVRNSLLVMLNRRLYNWMKELSRDQGFVSCVGLPDRAIEEQYDMELVLGCIVFRTLPPSALSNLGDLGDFLTDQATALAENKSFNYAGEEAAFRETFAMLSEQTRQRCLPALRFPGLCALRHERAAHRRKLGCRPEYHCSRSIPLPRFGGLPRTIRRSPGLV